MPRHPFMHPLGLGAAIALSLWLGAPSPAIACADLVTRFNEARATRELAKVVAAVRAIKQAGTCQAKDREVTKRQAALDHVAEAQRLAKTGASPDARLALLKRGGRLARPWQLEAAEGDALALAKDADGKPRYGEASLAYQSALDAIARAPTKPSREAVQRLLRLATQMRALAPTFVAGRSIVTRSPGGIAVAVVPVPVQFRYKLPEPGGGAPGATDMTDIGQRYAREAADLLKQDGMPRIRLVGHTDPVGSPEYNRGLGLRRAEALKRVLIEAGYEPARIEVGSHGKDRPVPIENAARLSEAERHAVLRRVEICFVEMSQQEENCR
jgi:OOP family OmpA-OmpF porin